jgi:DNA (cytosine-5)-methyltransferase 1
LKALDIFCGGGGSSYGARKAGITIAAAVDMWELATETFSLNFPEAHVVTSRLERVRPESIQERTGRIDVLLASPECTNHTCAKGSAPRSEASRATAMQVLRFAKVLRPRWLVMENVVHMRPWSRYGELKTELEILGYKLSEQILDATHFGVAQKRRRLFMIGDRECVPPTVSLPTQRKQRTVSDILDPPGTWPVSPLYKKGRATDTLARVDRALSVIGKRKPFLVVYYGTDGSGGWQSLDRPLRTITTIDRFALVEPSASGLTMRMLQVPELRRAMGFGSDYKLPCGTRRDKIKMLGNGVCPPVMMNVLSSITS